MSKPDLPDDDIRSIQYFWREKGDLDRWVGWDDAWPRIQERCPELAKAWTGYIGARRILHLVVNSLEEKDA